MIFLQNMLTMLRLSAKLPKLNLLVQSLRGLYCWLNPNLKGFTMRIERQSVLTGKTHVMDLPVTMHQYLSWREGMLIQDAMPNLSDDEREFIMTGITPEEWDAMLNNIDFS